jgi:hypothetical protein
MQKLSKKKEQKKVAITAIISGDVKKYIRIKYGWFVFFK